MVQSKCMPGPKKATGPRVGRPGVSKEAADRVRLLLHGALSRPPYSARGGLTRLAERLEMSQPALTQIMDGGGVSHETAMKVAAFIGEPIEKILALGTAPQNAPSALETCLDYHKGRWSPATVAAARAGLWPPDDDIEPEAWKSRLDALQKTLSAIVNTKH